MENFFDSIKNFSDLESLIKNKIRESEILEYKAAYNRLIPNDVAKDVSAMANSIGGIIIYGLETHPQDKTLPIKISGILESNIESFDQIVNSSIKKDIQGIRKKIIDDESGEIKCMIIQITQSEESPHQSLKDKRYYRRSGSQSIIMEHDIIELHFGKRLSPILDIDIENITGNKQLELLEGDEFSKSIKLRFFIRNSGKRIAKDVRVIFRLLKKDYIKIDSFNDTGSNIDDLYAKEGLQVRQIEVEKACHIQSRMRISEVEIRINNRLVSMDDAIITWRVFADLMLPQTKEVKLKDILI